MTKYDDFNLYRIYMPLGINPFCQEVFFIWHKYLYVVIIFLTNYYYYYLHDDKFESQ